jgi:hypothetical protein
MRLAGPRGQRDLLAGRPQYVFHAGLARSEPERQTVDRYVRRPQFAGHRLALAVEIAVRAVGIERDAIEIERERHRRGGKPDRGRALRPGPTVRRTCAVDTTFNATSSAPSVANGPTDSSAALISRADATALLKLMRVRAGRP